MNKAGSFTAYRGEITFKNRRYKLSNATQEDAEELATLYASVAVTTDNCRKRLDPENRYSFGNIGGIFNPLNEAELLDVINSDDSEIVVIKLNDDILGMLWVSLTDPSFENYCADNADLAAVLGSFKPMFFRDILARRAADRGVPGPSASSRNAADRRRSADAMNIPHMLLYGAIKSTDKAGCSLAEIYRLKYYTEHGTKTDLDMLNARSFNTALSAGGRFIGELAPKTIYKGGIEIGIIPSVVLFGYTRVKSTLEREMSEAGIVVDEGGGSA